MITKEIGFKNLHTNKERIIVRQFKDIMEAYEFARNEVKSSEYISHII